MSLYIVKLTALKAVLKVELCIASWNCNKHSLASSCIPADALSLTMVDVLLEITLGHFRICF